jgi:hypothetical protein
MRTLTTLTAAALCLLGTSAFAKEITEAQFTVGNWTGTAYTDDQTGEFFYCSAVVNYQQGETLEFAVYFDGAFSFYLSNPAVPRRKGDIFDVSMMTQNGYPIYAKFEAIDNTYLAATFTDTGNVAPWLSDATSLRILGIDDDQAYLLDNVNVVLIYLLGCAVERSNTVAAPAGNVPTSQPNNSPQNAPAPGNKLPPPRKP